MVRPSVDVADASDPASIFVDPSPRLDRDGTLDRRDARRERMINATREPVTSAHQAQLVTPCRPAASAPALALLVLGGGGFGVNNVIRRALTAGFHFRYRDRDRAA
jgi:hypothetical protein